MDKKEFDDIKDLIIDEFYDEIESYKKIKYNKDDDIKQSSTEFKNKMNSMLENMNALNDDTADFDINIMAIIDKAQEINKKKINFFELFIFILTSVSILGLFMLASLKLGKNFIIYFQIGVTLLLPLILIPISKNSLKEV